MVDVGEVQNEIARLIALIEKDVDAQEKIVDSAIGLAGLDLLSDQVPKLLEMDENIGRNVHRIVENFKAIREQMDDQEFAKSLLIRVAKACGRQMKAKDRARRLRGQFSCNNN